MPRAAVALQDSLTHLARILNPLLSVVFVLVSQDGKLLQANRGCRRLLGIAEDAPLSGIDASRLFIHPSFVELLALPCDANRPAYRGIINVGNDNTNCRSLLGEVRRHGERLLIVGEYDVVQMEALNAQVIELNEQLASMQRDLARSNRKLQDNEAHLTALSYTDQLTGLANRRQLMTFLNTEIERNRRYLEPLSVIMTDIDFFKHVNDTYGHDAGDALLLAFSRLMQANMRTVDLVARLGGEEFIVVMPNTPLTVALKTAERLRTETERLQIRSIPDSVTASFGVAEFQADDDAGSLLKHVDKAVYASKHSGRNRVTAYDSAMSRANGLVAP